MWAKGEALHFHIKNLNWGSFQSFNYLFVIYICDGSIKMVHCPPKKEKEKASEASYVINRTNKV
jgi:hypothetical protein